jgi:hypothetical protein
LNTEPWSVTSNSSSRRIPLLVLERA